MIRLEQEPYGTYLVVDEETGDDILFQTDCEFPSLASTFGLSGLEDITTSRAITLAVEYLDDHIGDVVEDPGYFMEG